MNENSLPRIISVALACALWAGPAVAEPLLGAKGAPAVCTAWTDRGDAIVLELKEGFPAADVAKAIGDALADAKVSVKGDTVVVQGVAKDALLAALETIDMGVDDVDAMLAELQAPGSEERGAGSSIRATKAADFSDVIGDEAELLSGKVLRVKRARFPLVFVTLKLNTVPKGLKGLRRGQTITVLPRVKSKNGLIDPADKTSKLNVGAWYAQQGDSVRIRLEAEKNDEVWVAAAFERTRK